SHDTPRAAIRNRHTRTATLSARESACEYGVDARGRTRSAASTPGGGVEAAGERASRRVSASDEIRLWSSSHASRRGDDLRLLRLELRVSDHALDFSAASRSSSSPAEVPAASRTYARWAASIAAASSAACSPILWPRAMRYTKTPRYGVMMTNITQR